MKQQIANASVVQQLPAAGYRGLPRILRSRCLLSIGYCDFVARVTGIFVVESSGFKNMLIYFFANLNSHQFLHVFICIKDA